MKTARLSGLQVGSPLPLELFALCPGALETERRFHTQYRQYWSHGEWFDLPLEVVQEIADLYGVQCQRARRLMPKPGLSQFDQDVYSLDLSELLQRMTNEGMLTPVKAETEWTYTITICPEHRMVNLPKCLLCIELMAAAA